MEKNNMTIVVAMNIFIFLLILRGILLNIVTFRILRRLYNYRTKETKLADPQRKIVIILSVYEETDLIEDAIQYIDSCIDNLDHIGVIIVGTSRERDNIGVNKTLDIAKKHTANKPTFQVLELDTKNGVKAHQVNYALRHIHTDERKTWVFLMDIDSRFSKAGLYEIIEAINDNSLVIQQHAAFLYNFNEISYIQKGQALYQSRWTITHEISRVVLNKITKYTIAHIVGHGLCINLELLRKYGGLPEETLVEDITLGYYLVASGQTIESTHVLELADCPNKFLDGFKQQKRWSVGAMLYPRYWINFKHKFPHYWRKNVCRSLLMMLQGVASYIVWIMTSWVLLIILISAESRFWLVSIFFLLYLTDFIQCIRFFYVKNYIKMQDLWIAPFLMITHVFLRSIPANTALFDFAVGGKIYNYKTKHKRARGMNNS